MLNKNAMVRLLRQAYIFTLGIVKHLLALKVRNAIKCDDHEINKMS
jgi:hypothetical protein